MNTNELDFLCFEEPIQFYFYSNGLKTLFLDSVVGAKYR